MVEVDAELERLKAHTRNARKRLSIRFGRDTPVHCRGKWTFEARQNHGLRAPGLMSFALAAIESGYKGDLPPPLPPRTKWTRRVPHPVLIGHAAYKGDLIDGMMMRPPASLAAARARWPPGALYSTAELALW